MFSVIHLLSVHIQSDFTVEEGFIVLTISKAGPPRKAFRLIR